MMELRNCRGRHRILTTEVGDADIVLGTRDKLRLALQKLLKFRAPRGIAVATRDAIPEEPTLRHPGTEPAPRLQANAGHRRATVC